ncbi:hypothetical protein [Rhodococcus sp. APC 3903]|uniref:hypothetical protein n=1 Tax=Rhodococcus sp. APC 3903 TaxID=3035193 RepID=UPI0025B4617A|nr:hypothetical protein [Rhodococcus sp. APC 3903]MDN3459895.1 hypothetical protein [Rhodococcus sp. APC 3903]
MRRVAILWVATIAIAILAVIAFFKVGAKTDDIAWVDEGVTAEVLRVAPSALAAVYTFSPDTFDADFDENVEGLNQSMADQLIQYRSAQHLRRRGSTQGLPWYENFDVFFSLGHGRDVEMKRRWLIISNALFWCSFRLF